MLTVQFELGQPRDDLLFFFFFLFIFTVTVTITR